MVGSTPLNLWTTSSVHWYPRRMGKNDWQRLIDVVSLDYLLWHMAILLKSIAHVGSIVILQQPKMFAKQSPLIKWCWLCSLMSEDLFSNMLFLQGKRLMFSTMEGLIALQAYVARKHPDIKHNWFTLGHIVLLSQYSIIQYHDKNKMRSMTQQLHSPDIVSSDSWMFPKHKKFLCSRQFDTKEQVACACQDVFKTISEEKIAQTFRKWVTR